MQSWGRLKHSLYQWYFAYVDLISPPRCVGCGHVGLPWCRICHEEIERLNEKNICERCGTPSREKVCEECISNPPPFVQARSFGAYKDVFRKVPTNIKYRQHTSLAEWFSSYLIEYVLSLEWQFDWVVPIPVSEKRMKSRGYNQVDLFARPFAWYLEKPYLPEALIKIKNSRSQVGLGRGERIKNMIKAFRVNPKYDVIGKRILLIDDVYTTGATTWFATRTLQKAGSGEVYVLTLARAIESSTYLFES